MWVSTHHLTVDALSTVVSLANGAMKFGDGCTVLALDAEKVFNPILDASVSLGIWRVWSRITSRSELSDKGKSTSPQRGSVLGPLLYNEALVLPALFRLSVLPITLL